MSCFIRLEGAGKTYRVSESHRPIGLWEALKAGADGPRTTDIVALAPLDLRIADGERVGIIGANGAGKTTLLQMIASLVTPTTGQVDVQGTVHPILNMGLSLRDELTGRENIFVDGELHGRSRDESDALAGEIIAFTELEAFIDLPVRIYSTGMRSRLAFALAIAVEPEILIVDEVLSVGDAYFNAKAQTRMQALAARGRIVLMVSHGLGAIRENCTRCLWLESGRLVMDSHPAEVTAAYEQAVAIADERQFAARARARHGESGTNEAGPRVEDIALCHRDGTPAAALIETEQDLDLVVRLDTGQAGAADGCVLHVDIRRLDGIHIARCAYADGPLPAGRSALRYEMRPFALGPGVYEFEAVLSRAVPLARGASCTSRSRRDAR